MKSLLHVTLISLGQRLFAKTPIEGYYHLYPTELVDKIYDYTPLITGGPIIDVVTPQAQTYADIQYPNWDSTCTVVENVLLDQMMKVIDPLFDINNLAGGSTGLFKNLRSGNTRNIPQNAPVSSLSPLLNYNSVGVDPVLFVVIYDTQEVVPECDSTYCRLFACVTTPQTTTTTTTTTSPCDTSRTCLFLSLISNLYLYEGGYSNVVGEFRAVEVYAACEVPDLSEYTIYIGAFSPGYQLPSTVLPKGQYFIATTTSDYYTSNNCQNPSCPKASGVGYLDNLLYKAVYLSKKGDGGVDFFNFGSIYFDSYVLRKNQTSPNDGWFEPNDWTMAGKSALYYNNWYDADGQCPYVPLNTFQC
eukprot:GHVR01063316.1.p1 GENE.GHVR01063316.1~~GHVR01063316.1.p1  ORF type:complete len:359 (+),score=34.79 GHVR01063316.1:49-1125(+)